MAMNHHHHHHHHHHHTEYAIPVIRPPSPASSIGTVYRADQTSPSDSELYLPQPNFEQKWEEKNGIHKVMEEEEVANRDPLLPRPQSLREQEALVDAILRNLRKKVKELQDNDLFEQTLLRGSQASLEPQPTTDDIDSILRSMMGPGMNINGLSVGGVHQAARKVVSESVTDGPWNNYGKDPVFERGNSQVPESLNTSATTVGKRSRSGRSRRP